MTRLLTPKQVAQAIGVSESSLKRWCDKGLLATIRTAGGHRRLALDEVFQFLRRSDQELVRPELLGLPSNTGRGEIVLTRAREQISAALVTGDEEQCRRIVLDLYLAGQSVCEICDRVLAEAFHEIGDRWECGEVSIYRERRACEIGSRALHELRSAMPTPRVDAPQAIGGTMQSDPYRLPTAMIEVVLRELGWQATSLGTELPSTTFAEALHDNEPKLLWLSISSFASSAQFLEDYAEIHRVAEEVGAAVVVGGRALSTEIRQEMVYSAFCDNLRHMVTFVDTLQAGVGQQQS
ncbi:B12-binding domain-containing protein [Bythopirellula goksoeyrii]|uniref:MerR family regulatory protein n=1 Tax=Bythopirellula goksoeyrii TaxID=1400387 RepID=A0A5B9QID0_9BACT|nr:B12-binding domain-containing protein [Bythopirellula goksoeyrii]QEG37452.1 MerR family regulatory protein [Bythopirellula goksoeyrii]